MAQSPTLETSAKTEDPTAFEKQNDFVLVMKGGGAKGFAYLGALQVLEKYYKFTWFVGTSAGAIAAILLAAGYSVKILESKMNEKSFKDFMDAKWYKWLPNLVFKKGIFPALELNNWLEGLLNEKLTPGNASPVTLGCLKHRATIYASRRGTEALDFDSHNSKEEEAVYAVRSSVAIPYIFQPQTDGKQRLYDGGLRHNFPLLPFLNKYNKKNKLKFIGLYLGENIHKHKPLSRFIFPDLLGNWLSNSDEQALKDYKDQIVIINPSPISTLKFNLSNDEKEFLLASGRAAALAFVTRQPNIKIRPSEDEVEQAKTLANSLRTNIKKTYRKKRWQRNLLLAFFLLAFVALFLGILKYGLFNYETKPVQIDSLVVMPIEKCSSESQNDCEGLSYRITNSLSRIPNLKIAARSSVLALYKKDFDVKNIGQQLSVKTALTWEIIERDNHHELFLQLVDIESQTALKTYIYRFNKNEMMLQERRILMEVGPDLKPDLSILELNDIAKTYTQNPKAASLYADGLHFYNNRGQPENISKAMDKFIDAMLEDPKYALPYQGIADCYLILEEYLGEDPKITLPRANEFAQKALNIDESLPETHTSLGFIKFSMWDWKGAENEFITALTKNPNSPQTLLWYAVLLRTLGRYEEAIDHLNVALTLDPKTARIFHNLAMIHIMQGKPDTAIEYLKKALELDENNGATYLWLSVAYLQQQKNCDKARDMARTGDNKLKHQISSIAFLGYAYAKCGDVKEAEKLIEELTVLYDAKPLGHTPAHNIAMIYAGLDKKDETFEWLNKGYENKMGLMPMYIVFPHFNDIKEDDRYNDLLKNLNIPKR